MASRLLLCYDAVVAAALMAVVAIVCGVALITGDSPPNFPVATIAFVLICAFIFLRLSSRSRTSAFPLG